MTERPHNQDSENIKKEPIPNHRPTDEQLEALRYQYPIQHKYTFEDNPIIAQIKHDKRWTVSDKQKRPIDILLLKETGEIKMAEMDEFKMIPLSDLPFIDSIEELDFVNRTYRLQAHKNRIICIDVEPYADPELKFSILNSPVGYAELSENGGIHALIKVPESFINDENRYLFDELSVFKEPTLKENGKEVRTGRYEVLINDHYTTFTKRIMKDIDTEPDYTTGENKQWLENFIAHIVKEDQERQKVREQIRKIQLEGVENELNDEQKSRVRKIMTLPAFDEIKEELEIKLDGKTTDMSEFEMYMANSATGYTLNIIKRAKTTRTYGKIASRLTEMEIIYIVYYLLQDVLPFREKHDEFRQGVPWLLHLAQKAYVHTTAKRKLEAKTKKKG